MNINYRSSISFVVLILFCFLNTECMTAQGPVSWQTYTYDSDGFSILCPGVLNLKTKAIPTSIGVLQNVNYSLVYAQDHPNFLYNINTIQYPEETIELVDQSLIDEMIKENLSALEENLDCKLLYHAESDFDKAKQVLFRMSNEEKGIIVKGKILFTSNTIYTLIVHTTKSESLNTDMDRFLDSFKLL